MCIYEHLDSMADASHQALSLYVAESARWCRRFVLACALDYAFCLTVDRLYYRGVAA